MEKLFFYQEVDKETLDCFESFLIQISLLCDKHRDKVLNEWLDAGKSSERCPLVPNLN